MPKLIVYRGRTKTLVADLRGKEFVVGRLRNCHLQLEDHLVSRRHARFFLDDEHVWWVEDLETKHGIWRDGERVDKVPLLAGDLLVIGQHLVIYEMGELRPDEARVADKARKRMTDPGTDPTATLPVVTVEHLVQRAHVRATCHVVVDLGDGPEGIELTDDRYTIGFAADADIRLKGRSWLAPQVILLRDGMGRWFASAAGRGKVLLNGRPIEVEGLADGDNVELQGRSVKFHEQLHKKGPRTLEAG